VRAVRRRLAEVGPEFTRADGDFDRISLSDQDGDVLRDLLVDDHARTVIEIGLAYGSSALAIGEALVLQGAGTEGSTHVVIDPYQHTFGDAGWDAIVAAGLEGISTLLAERSQVALPRLAAEGFVADAAFVDGSHIFHRVFVDLAFLHEIVRPGGLIVLDDCQWPAVATAARYFEVNTGWEPLVLATLTRLRAFRVPDPRAESAFEDFTPFHLD
jgi:predicted O-methyltransferase YrrM